MNLNNYTIKSQEAVQQAVQIATINGQQSIENGHILKGILEVDEHVTPFILKKLNVNTSIFTKLLRAIQKFRADNPFYPIMQTKPLQKPAVI